MSDQSILPFFFQSSEHTFSSSNHQSILVFFLQNIRAYFFLFFKSSELTCFLSSNHQNILFSFLQIIRPYFFSFFKSSEQTFFLQIIRAHLSSSSSLSSSPCASSSLFVQRPKKSELSGWQLSTRKNFPDEVRKSFSRQKKCA